MLDVEPLLAHCQQWFLAFLAAIGGCIFIFRFALLYISAVSLFFQSAGRPFH